MNFTFFEAWSTIFQFKCLEEKGNNTVSFNLFRTTSSAPTDPFSRWLKEFLKFYGIDTSIFARHSIRTASTSKSKQVGLSLLENLLLYQRRFYGIKFLNSMRMRKPWNKTLISWVKSKEDIIHPPASAIIFMTLTILLFLGHHVRG